MKKKAIRNTIASLGIGLSAILSGCSQRTQPYLENISSQLKDYHLTVKYATSPEKYNGTVILEKEGNKINVPHEGISLDGIVEKDGIFSITVTLPNGSTKSEVYRIEDKDKLHRYTPESEGISF